MNNEKAIAIVVYKKSFFGHGNPPVFKGHKIFEENNKSASETIFLLFDEREKHYDTILNLIGAGGNKYFCWQCNKGYKTINGHRCVYKCTRCFSIPFCENKEPKIVCEKCNREFYERKCFENHKKFANRSGEKIICEKVYYCKTCLVTVNVDLGKHECGIHYCKTCRSKHKHNELCYMQPAKVKVFKKKTLFYFYDFETRQDTSYQNHVSNKIHIPNLAVVQSACDDCMDNNNIAERCETCGIREFIFKKDLVKSSSRSCLCYSIREVKVV